MVLDENLDVNVDVDFGAPSTFLKQFRSHQEYRLWHTPNGNLPLDKHPTRKPDSAEKRLRAAKPNLPPRSEAKSYR